jgi:hypothetical protein
LFKVIRRSYKGSRRSSKGLSVSKKRSSKGKRLLEKEVKQGQKEAKQGLDLLGKRTYRLEKRMGILVDEKARTMATSKSENDYNPRGRWNRHDGNVDR